MQTNTRRESDKMVNGENEMSKSRLWENKMLRMGRRGAQYGPEGLVTLGGKTGGEG